MSKVILERGGFTKMIEISPSHLPRDIEIALPLPLNVASNYVVTEPESLRVERWAFEYRTQLDRDIYLYAFKESKS